MADPHKHGSMDTSHHEKTFASFVNIVKYAVYVIIALLVLLAIFRT